MLPDHPFEQRNVINRLDVCPLLEDPPETLILVAITVLRHQRDQPVPLLVQEEDGTPVNLTHLGGFLGDDLE